MDGKKQSPPQYQVFINFRGAQLRNNFIGHVEKAMKGSGINVFIDTYEQKGEDIKVLLKRIEESRVALAIFSTRYTESPWCLDELVTIKKRVDLGMLEVSTESVKQLVGEFGDHFRRREWEYRFEKSKIDEWKKALVCVSGKIGLTLDEKSSESDFIGLIVTNVLELLAKVSSKEQTAKAQVKQLFGKGETSSATWHSKYNIVEAPHEKLKTTQPIAGVGFGAGGSSSAYPTINPAWLPSASSLSRGSSLAPNADTVSRLGSQSPQVPYSIMSTHHGWTTGSTGTGPTNGSIVGVPPMQGTYNMSQRAGSAYAKGNALAPQINQLISVVQQAQQPYSTAPSSLAPSGLNAQYGQGQVIYSSSTSFNGVPISKYTYLWNQSPRGQQLPPSSHFPPKESVDYDSE